MAIRQGPLENLVMTMDTHFWSGKKVFLTGHTGFKGGWLSLWLSSMGAITKGYGLRPETQNNFFEIASVNELVDSEINDIRDYSSLSASIYKFRPEIIFHMAAQPLVRRSYKNPLETYQVNVMGTANLLEAARQCDSVRSIVNITTDKCYQNNEWIWGYKETDPMGGIDPYSCSKGCSELVTASFRDSFLLGSNIGIASARAGNVIGGGDWAVDRLIPDVLASFDKGIPVIIRNKEAIRPWQHVLEPLSGYLKLAQSLFKDPEKFSEGWNFGPYEHSVKTVGWILDYLTELWPGVGWKLDKGKNPHEALSLKLDISKSCALLEWSPKLSIESTLHKIIEWHMAWREGGNMRDISLKEIKSFTTLSEE
jgi:CDP-glucose 4,6-dehydratase